MRIDLRGVRARAVRHVPGELGHRHLHPEADPEEGHAVLARILHGTNLPLGTAAAETVGNQDPLAVSELRDALELLGVDVLDVDLGADRDAGVHERLVEALVRLGEVHVLPHHRDREFLLRIPEHLDDRLPLSQVRPAGAEA